MIFCLFLALHGNPTIDSLRVWYAQCEVQYKDSSDMVWVHEPDPTSGCIFKYDGTCIVTSHWHGAWVKHDPTFKEFIEFLRDRNKQ